ncbi:uncharacterized protein VTP21DRAFT_4739 [Calcarisporiella thermophila]|uniref:uncharacterized protein n=1 Tax=Calcarisporiella thermophila TaxID=911321 RepID=UPI0037425DE0
MADLGFDFSDLAMEEEEPTSAHNGELTKSPENALQNDMPLSIDDLSSDALLEAMAIESSDTTPEAVLLGEEGEFLADRPLPPAKKMEALTESSFLFHRNFLAKELPSLLREMDLHDAVERGIPVLKTLAEDPEEGVRETLSSVLEEILLFYLEKAPPDYSRLSRYANRTNTEAVALKPSTELADQPSASAKSLDSGSSERSEQDKPRAHIPPQAFAPILINLLQSQNSTIVSQTTQAIVTMATNLPEDIIDNEVFEGIVMGLYRQGDETPDIDSGGAEAALCRIIMLSVISSLAPILGADKCTGLFIPLLESRANDQDHYARREAATTVGSLADVVPQDIVVSKLIPLYTQFAHDSIWHVRRSAVTSLPHLLSHLPSNLKSEMAVQAIELFRDDVSRSVRNALGTIIGELFANFLNESMVPDALVQFFLSLVTPSGEDAGKIIKLEPDRASTCAYNFPAVVLTMGIDRWEELREAYLILARDHQFRVRRTLAYSLHEIARIIGPENADHDLVSIFALYLMDVDDVKQGVLEGLASFIECLPLATRCEYLPLLKDVWESVTTNWRQRCLFVSQIGSLCNLYGIEEIIEHLLPLILRACMDEVSSVRESGVKCFPNILENALRHVPVDSTSKVDSNAESAPPTPPLEIILSKLDDFLSADSYRSRVVFVQIWAEITRHYSYSTSSLAWDFGSWFLPRLFRLARDPVVNVRISVARSIAVLMENRKDEENKALEEVVSYLSQDASKDVRSFVARWAVILGPESAAGVENTGNASENRDNQPVEGQGEEERGREMEEMEVDTQPLCA